MTQEQVAKLLNRTLTSSEVTNFDMYLNIAIERLEQLVCFSLCDNGGSRTYDTRHNYRSLYVDPFTAITSVTVDDVVTTEYTLKQNNNYNGSWYNIIEFDDKMHGDKVVVDAVWGFDCIPYDIQMLIAKLFGYILIEQTADNQVKSKKIEDFSVTYKDSTTYDEFINANQATINKYSQCNVGRIDSGRVHHVRTIY